MDLDLAAIDTVLDAFKNVALVEVAKRRHQRNSLSLISKLPIEIMFNIFIEFLPPQSDENQYRLLETVKLSSICRTWRELIEGNPRFWTVLDTRTAPPLTQLSLKNSGTSLISLVGPITDGPHAKESFLAACEHTGRWSSVDVTAPRSKDFEIFQDASVPKLKTLILSCTPRRSRLGMRVGPGPLHLFGGDTPLLESVELTGVEVAWSSLMWRNLQSLQLDKVEGPNATRFFDILEACPGLHSFALRKFVLADPQNLDPSKRIPIFLPSLETVGFEALDLNLIKLCIAILQCPTLTYLYVGNPKDHHSDTPPDFDPLVTFARQFVHKNTSSKHKVEIKSGDDMFGIFPLAELSTGLGLRGLDEVAERVCQSFTREPITAWIDDAGSYASWSRLETLPGCTILKTQSNSPRLFRYLGTPVSTDNGIKSWPFPHLHTIFLYDVCDVPEDILQMVRSRSRNISGGAGDARVEPPARLKKLVLVKGCSMDREIVVRIEMVLGGGTVVQDDDPGFGPWDQEEEDEESDSDWDSD